MEKVSGCCPDCGRATVVMCGAIRNKCTSCGAVFAILNTVDEQDKKGPGRPKGSTIPEEQLKKNRTYKMSPEWIDWLEEMKAQGHSKTYCIEKGLELLRAHLSG